MFDHASRIPPTSAMHGWEACGWSAGPWPFVSNEIFRSGLSQSQLGRAAPEMQEMTNDERTSLLYCLLPAIPP